MWLVVKPQAKVPVVIISIISCINSVMYAFMIIIGDVAVPAIIPGNVDVRKIILMKNLSHILYYM